MWKVQRILIGEGDAWVLQRCDVFGWVKLSQICQWVFWAYGQCNFILLGYLFIFICYNMMTYVYGFLTLVDDFQTFVAFFFLFCFLDGALCSQQGWDIKGYFLVQGRIYVFVEHLLLNPIFIYYTLLFLAVTLSLPNIRLWPSTRAIYYVYLL